MNSARFLAAFLCVLHAGSAFGQGSAPATLSRDAKPAASASPKVQPAADGKKKKDSILPGLDDTKSKEPVTTEIYSDQASFDSAKYVGVFSGHVIVNDPRFNVQADKLTIFLHKGGEGEESEGLEKAIAEGNVGVVRDRPDAKGGPSQRAIGRADKAVYTAKDGNVEMTGSPRVQQGLNSHVATSPETVMVLNQSGQLQTRGPSRTEIRQEPKAPEQANPEAGKAETAPAKKADTAGEIVRP